MSILAHFRWQDLVDILLNSYILFRLYVLFRGTYVFRVLTGIAFLWIFQRVAVFFGLILTSWAMQGITAVAALIIIIIFRNEISNVLQAKNLKAILWGFPKQSVQTPIEIIVDSINTLSEHHNGALIVFPLKKDLQDVMQSGIPWRGLVSKEMITSIFWPDNPVHDGAAIIQGNRITEVGVILPLSHRNDLPSHYGTRHRAALGLSESTDALVIVVSEETGNILVAKDSVITKINDNTELVKALQKHMGIAEEEPAHLRKEKLEISIAALVSILFITGMWLSFSKGLDTLITLEIPVEYAKHDPGIEIVDTSVNTVQLQLGGSGALIKSVRPDQVQVRLDLGNAVIGSNVFSITQENISLPPGIFLSKVAPSVVEVTLDKTITKQLPVQVDWVGKLPENLILSQLKIDPEKIEIIGGKRILENISTLYTEKVPLGNINKTGTTIVSLALNPASLKIANSSKDRIKLTYVVKTKRKLKSSP
ncbi:MAG: DNA integrity scanning protein DisA nucleotide-binding domain protein [Deltaproteobacteria bacterium]|nr:DNA integrity scanning protein DisA nucleotide-binding domain protein [Deltaproteobacteria bacterium]